MKTGVQSIPYRIPEKWSSEWFGRFIRDVLANADSRNAIAGAGITITGTPDIPATISASDDLQQLLVQSYVLVSASGFLNFERVLRGETGVVTLVDGGPNSTLQIKIGTIPYSKMPTMPALSVLGNPEAGAAATTPISGAAQFDVLHIDLIGSDLDVQFSAIDHRYISDFDEEAQDAVGTILVDSATIDFTYTDATPAITAIVIDNSITDEKFRQSAALSVVGRASNTTGNTADITSASDDTVLRRTSSTVNWGQLTAGMFPATILSSGTYTPTLTNVANLDASTARLCTWMRVGNMVTVAGQFDADPTLTLTATQLGVSLPVASALTTAFQLGGTANAIAIAGQSAGIYADAANDRAQVEWKSGDVTNQTMTFQFSYQVL